MARFLDDQEFIQKCREHNRKIDLKIMIDWFKDGEFETIESADDEFIKLNLSRELEGNIGQAIMDQGTLVLDNSNNDYSPKSIASRFNRELGEEYEFNIIPNRPIAILISVNNSDYKIYYTGNITDIEPNYDNSRVSLTIEDSMIDLQNTPAPDKLYIEENAKDVIKDLLNFTGIDFVDDLVDDINQTITYNFYEDGSVFNALQKIAEMVWGKFFVSEEQLVFINYKTLDQTSMDIVENLEDDVFLQSGYSERLSSQDLYTKVVLESSPLYFQGDSNNKQVVWTGSEQQATVTETYYGSDIKNGTLQLKETADDGITTTNTSNVPIAEGSVSVRFGENVYTEGRGLKAFDYGKGRIYFTNSGTYPLPPLNQEIEVNYTYYILVLPPNGEPKEIIAKFDNPVIEVSDIKDYLNFTTTEVFQDIEYSAYTTSISGFLRRSAGTYNSSTLTVSENAQTVRVSGNIRIKNADYKYFWGRGTDKKNATATIYLVENGNRVKQIKRYTTGWNTSYYDSGRVPISPSSKIKLQVVFDGTGEKYSEVQLYNVTVNVGEALVNEFQEEISSVDVEQINYPDNRRTKLIFTNKSDFRVSVTSNYQGEEIDNIYLEGIPLTRGKEYNIEKENIDASQAFNLYDKELSIQNDLFRSEDRMKQTVDFLLDNYSTPKSELNTTIRGLGHIDLLDKIYVNRNESDIDNYFLIYGIEEDFTEEGEWNQTLELRQASSSKWDYKPNGFVSIVDTPDSPTLDVYPTPKPIENVEISENTWKNRDGSYNVNLDVSLELPNYAFMDEVRIFLKEGDSDYSSVGSTTDTNYRIRGLRIGETYQVKAVLINTRGNSSEPTYSNTIKTTGEITRPPYPSNFKVAQLNDSAVFKWDEVSTRGIAGYEIRRGNTWEDSILVNTELKSNRYREDLNYNGTYKYMIKTIDNAGQYSINYNEYVTTFRDIDSDINILLEYDEVDNLGGSGAGFAKLDGELALATTVTFNDLPAETFSTLESNIGLSSFPSYMEEFIYETEPVDTFKVGRTGVRLDYNIQSVNPYTSFSSYGGRTFNSYPYDTFSFVTQVTDYKIEMSLSNDGTTWSNWETYLEGQYEFRYIKFRIIILVESETLEWKLQNFNQIIDVPDKKLIIEDLQVDNTGTTVNFNNYSKDFYNKPQEYWASIMSNGQFTYPVFSNVTSEELTVELIDSNNNNVSGVVNLYVEGY